MGIDSKLMADHWISAASGNGWTSDLKVLDDGKTFTLKLVVLVNGQGQHWEKKIELPEGMSMFNP